MLHSLFFDGLDSATAALVMAHLPAEVWPAGRVIFEDNAPGETLYIVASGLVQVSKTLENGQIHVLGEMGAGEFFGEMALLEDKPRSARVTTLTMTHLLAVSRSTFNTLMEQYPIVAINILRQVSARLRARNIEQERLLRDKQGLVEELATKNLALQRALQELQAAMATVAEHERVQRDLEIAHQIQRQMLPAEFPQEPGLCVHATTVPSMGVGGDFYDAVRLDAQRIGLLLGDVSGKGIPAAMQMARLMGEFRACVSHRSNPAGVMQVLNSLVCQRNTTLSSFVTVQYIELDVVERFMRFICAGHPPILLRHTDGQIERLGTIPNIPLGIEETFVYNQEERQLVPGDMLLLYSDGAYELRDRQDSQFGLPRLMELFATVPTHPKAAICAIQTALEAFGDEHGPHDDTTLLCLQLLPEC